MVFRLRLSLEHWRIGVSRLWLGTLLTDYARELAESGIRPKLVSHRRKQWRFAQLQQQLR